MQISEKAIAEFQKIHKEKYGEDLSYEEASKQAFNLMQFTKCLVDLFIKDEKRKHRLKTEPKGFPLDGSGYTCSICNQHTKQGHSWYDKYGIKCSICQKGINKKQIPASIAKKQKTWYSTYDLESRFNIKSPTLKRWVKDGILKSRAIKNEQGNIHVQIFLIKDNKDFLPPKKLTESQLVQEERDGTLWTRSEPWYKFVDPFKHLKDYKIMDYMQFSEPKNKTK